MRMRSFRPQAECPLDGVRVLDLSRLVAGNMLSLQLADFGAEVIKIESPDRGDPLREWRVAGVSAYWKVYARNKKSITLNLRTAEGRDLLLRLVEGAQVFIENFRPGTLEEIGLAPATLHARNAHLIIVRISGWGQDGPYRDRPGFGTLVEGMSGFAARNGYADRPPVLPPLALADIIAGLSGAAAVLVALREIEVNGGAGQIIDLLMRVDAAEEIGLCRTHAAIPAASPRPPPAHPRRPCGGRDGHTGPRSWRPSSAPTTSAPPWPAARARRPLCG
jgi:crotonobetainyl-CoA:carnitine CoA-transferase CaiB-like acyl-CoA transferase